MSTLRSGANTSTAPTAKYLQSRINHLSTLLLKRYIGLLSAAGSSPSTEPDSPNADATKEPVPSAIETVSAQIDIEVETQAIIKLVEEMMVLTRGLKELWLFGALQTVDTEEGRVRKEKERKEMSEEVLKVREGLDRWLEGWAERQVAGEANGAAEVAAKG